MATGVALAAKPKEKPSVRVTGSCGYASFKPKADDSVYPGEKYIKNVSNLRRTTGSAYVALGDRIIFSGTVVDETCLPVPGAKVEIWHADAQGKYKHKVKKYGLSKDDYFLGGGYMLTDNLGHFQFLTIFPGNYDKRAPHINFRITHPDYPTREGDVFFELHPANDKDPVLTAITKSKQEPLIASPEAPAENALFEDRVFDVQIGLNGRNKFKTY